ncbi:MAG: hypothetical protein WC212_04980 [Candidatus Delongbacteria bacterium]
MDKPYKHLLSFTVICLFCIFGFSCSGNYDSQKTKNVTKTKVVDTDIEYMVRVSINDDTKMKPIHDKAEIWFKGLGSWFFKSELKSGGTVKDLGKCSSDKTVNLMIYPNSREGEEISIPIKMNSEMNPNGSPRDMITIDFSDEYFTVFGLPVKEANGKFELKYNR